jgi:homopolymeric O-antigen transport system permease protein
MWEFRELLFFLVWRDIKVRYKQAALGAAWAVLQPLLSMVIFTLVFGRLAGMPSDGLPYPVFVFCALLPWTYFANALAAAANSLVGSSNLVTKVYFPRLFIPASAAFAGLLDLAVAFPILLVMVAWYGIAPGWGLLALPALLALTIALALGVGTWLSALNVKYRDVRYAIPFLIQLWMFATPVVYPLSLASQKVRFVLALNPVAGLVEGYRASILGRPLPWGPLGLAAASAALLLGAGTLYFQKVERDFADVV